MLPSAAAVLFIQRSFYVKKKRAVIFILLFQNLVKQFSNQKWHPHPTCYLVWLWACAAPSLSACSKTGFEWAARTFLRQGDSPKDTECSCHSHVLPGFEREMCRRFLLIWKREVCLSLPSPLRAGLRGAAHPASCTVCFLPAMEMRSLSFRSPDMQGLTGEPGKQCPDGQADKCFHFGKANPDRTTLSLAEGRKNEEFSEESGAFNGK